MLTQKTLLAAQVTVECGLYKWSTDVVRQSLDPYFGAVYHLPKPLMPDTQQLLVSVMHVDVRELLEQVACRSLSPSTPPFSSLYVCLCPHTTICVAQVSGGGSRAECVHDAERRRSLSHAAPRLRHRERPRVSCRSRREEGGGSGGRPGGGGVPVTLTALAGASSGGVTVAVA